MTLLSPRETADGATHPNDRAMLTVPLDLLHISPLRPLRCSCCGPPPQRVALAQAVAFVELVTGARSRHDPATLVKSSPA